MSEVGWESVLKGIESVMDEHDLTLKDVADRSGVSKSTVRRILNRQNCRYVNLVRVANALGRHITYVFEDE